MVELLSELSQAVAEVAGRVAPAVVGVGASGSGVLVGGDAVLTNAHNLRGDEVVVTFADGERQPATIAGADVDGDLAVLSVDAGGRTPLGRETATVRPGELVVALANPGGRGTRVSVGAVAALGVAFRGPSGRRVGGGIEHSAPLPRGSSGGALVSAEGQMLGLNTARAGDGFYIALPANAALWTRVDALARGETPARVRLGVALAPPAVAARLRRAVGLAPAEGLLVQAVEADGPAGRAGILAGDLLVAAGARPLRSVDDLADALAAAGETIEIGLVRGVEDKTLTVTL